ncbi:restriction endonuclease subunit S [Aeromonas caviae]|uniref:restriction endonuclease subunit S n=1 Tax=Aeromonas caviae TaxID=648 RepID=UPI00191D3B2C|nr:restriction endonuclease subunit S [Aeromonas caviae]MBL0547966.1 restriction endonuclease subunit S [Aeromonas caviae]
MSAHWTTKTLGDCLEKVVDNRGKTPPLSAERTPYPMVEINAVVGSVKSPNLDVVKKFVTEETYNSWFRAGHPQYGDILFSTVGSIAEVVIVKSEICCIAQNLIGLRAKNALLDHDYLYYFLANPKTKSLLLSLDISSVQPSIKVPHLLAIEISYPNLGAQKRIAELLASLDDRIALLSETNATLEAIAQALFKSWFVDFDPVHARARGEQPAGLAPEVAALFPDCFEESALGKIPKGWKLMQFGEFIDRQSVGKKYDQKSALEEGSVPILDQGKSGVIGFHNNKPSVCASLVSPVVVFANHTCYMRLITFDFSAIQNVLPFIGKGVDTVWAFYATKDRVKFSEYKGHWPEFVIQKTIVPNQELTEIFRNMVDPLICSMRNNELQAQTLANLRDTLLPRLISGQLRLPEAEAMVEGAS